MKKKKDASESQSRFSLPEKKSSSIVDLTQSLQETKQQKHDKQASKKKLTKAEKSVLMTIHELETPNFKQQ